MNALPDTGSALAGLKDFQRATVDYVFERFFGRNSVQRFLVADEVGLGKTLVARGVIARTIERLWDSVKRIDIIYICSNADIARQNVDRLRIRGCEKNTAQSTRLTLLPLDIGTFDPRLNFVALTPATSFEHAGGGGLMLERVLIYWLLHRAWNIHGARSSLYVMRVNAGTDPFERAVNALEQKKINQDISDAFVSALEKHVREDKAAGRPDLKTRFCKLQEIFCRSDSRVTADQKGLRYRWIGEMRMLLARVCLAALEPDLIILDEFQRFKHLLEEQSPAGELAQDLFRSSAGLGARVLLLSATPYRGLTLNSENEDDHYTDFFALLRFLENGDASGCAEVVKEYRDALTSVLNADSLDRVRRAKTALENRLRQVMVRTERSALGEGDKMLSDSSASNIALTAVDVRSFLGAQCIADTIKEGDVIEYWKSAPYLFNFMDNYALKDAFRDAPDKAELVRHVRLYPETFLNVQRMREYQPVEPANPRLRSLIEETVDLGMWRLMWIPPSLSYYSLAGPYADPQLGSVTKRLIFSAWHMVPRAVASITSYEAERHMMRSSTPDSKSTQEDWKKQRGLLRFNSAEGRLTGMPLFLLVYPCLTFALRCDPRDFSQPEVLSAHQIVTLFARRITSELEKLAIPERSSGPVDERWYWVVPILLDYANFEAMAKAWWGRPELALIWSGSEAEVEDAAWPKHVEHALAVVTSLRDGTDALGPRPDNLFEVLALAASAAPATGILRACARTLHSRPDGSLDICDLAAQSSKAFLSLFNRAEVTEAVRSAFPGEPYWLRVLEYAHAGGLQSTLDEYAHLLRESLGVASLNMEEAATKICAELVSALTIRTATLRVDEISAPPYAREVGLRSEPMRIRFAMRFGDERSDEESPGVEDGASPGKRKERVRAAFNSPFWPFVLISTSVGQEGLDFHHYCHSLTHWNLPSNPVDLEQREGRINRYKGHAIRKNIASTFAQEALRAKNPDVWENAFNKAKLARLPSENDLVPYWHFPGTAKIERHAPTLPLSREVERYEKLRRILAIYRLVFGQSRQEDLIDFILREVSEEKRADLVAQLQIDLTPQTREPGLDIRDGT